MIVIVLRAIVLSARACRGFNIMWNMRDVELYGRARLLKKLLIITVFASLVMIGRYQALLRARVALSSTLVPRCRTNRLATIVTLPVNASIVLCRLVAHHLMLKLHEVA